MCAFICACVCACCVRGYVMCCGVVSDVACCCVCVVHDVSFWFALPCADVQCVVLDCVVLRCRVVLRVLHFVCVVLL